MHIPDGLFDEYYEVCDELLNNEHIGKDCTVFYPPKREACSNCQTVRLAAGSSNIYKTGGPIPFTHGFCPFCAGVGYKETSQSEAIRLRLYWSRRDWLKVSSSIQIADATLMTIGFAEDMTKCLKAQYILIINDQTVANYRYVLAGEPFFHGFGKNRYFIAYWKRDK